MIKWEKEKIGLKIITLKQNWIMKHMLMFFLPDAPKVSTDPPYRPEEYMDDYELQKAYKEICSKKLKTKQDKNIEIYSENKE